jgi:hypothetical protein
VLRKPHALGIRSIGEIHEQLRWCRYLNLLARPNV